MQAGFYLYVYKTTSDGNMEDALRLSAVSAVWAAEDVHITSFHSRHSADKYIVWGKSSISMFDYISN